MLKSHGFAINLSSTDRCFCGEIDDIKHFFMFCFIWQEERKDLFLKLNQILPNFSQKSVKNQCEILLHGININSLRPDPRNNKIVFEVQKFISKTNRFSKHYDWSFYAYFISYHTLSFLSYFLYPFILLRHNQSQIPPIPINPPHNLWLI